MKWETIQIQENNSEFPLEFLTKDNREDRLSVVYFSDKHASPGTSGATRMYGGDIITVPMFYDRMERLEIKAAMELFSDSDKNPLGYVINRKMCEDVQEFGYMIVHNYIKQK